MFEQLCQHTIIQLTIAHLLTHQLHNRSHTLLRGTVQELRDIREIARFATKLLSTVLLTIEICVKPQCAFTIYHETTLDTVLLLSQIDRGGVGRMEI